MRPRLFRLILKRPAKLVAKWRPEHWFLAIALFFGSFFIVLTPPQKGPDEWSHFFRAYQVSNLRIIARHNSDGGYGDLLPKSLSKTDVLLTGDNVLHDPNTKASFAEARRFLFMKLNPWDRTEVNFTATATYSPVPYLAPALAMEPGKLLGLSPEALIYLGRIAGLAAWALLIFLAVRFTPVGKWAFVALALIPVSLFQASVISADGATNALAFLLVALTLRLWLRDRRISRGELAAYTLVAGLLALAKPTYALLAALVILIPRRNFGSFKRSTAIKAGIIALCFILSAAWQWAVKPISTYGIAHPLDMTVLLSPKLQLQDMRANPQGSVLLIVDNVFTNAADSLYKSATSTLGSFDIDLPIWTMIWVWIVIGITLLSMAPYAAESESRLALKRLAVLGLIFLNLFLVLLGLYLTSTPVGWGIIYGEQGRYLIAFSGLLIPLALSRHPFLKVDPLALRRFVAGSYAAILIVAVVAVYFRYYIDARIPYIGS